MACYSETSIENLNPSLPRAGVIDIGSNAIRLLIGSIDSRGEMKRIIKKREAIRLGGDVFSQNLISNQRMDEVISAISQFTKDFKKNNVGSIRAVATSAVREAHNRDDFISRVFQETGINVDIIDGQQESKSILTAVYSTLQKKNQNLFIMDIGGGSVEFILSSHGAMTDSISLPLGTIRMLEDMEKEGGRETINGESLRKIDLKEKNGKGKDARKKGPLSYRKKLGLHYESSLKSLKDFLKDSPKDFTFIGTGGNLECLGQLRKYIFKRTSHTKIKAHELDYIVDDLFNLNYEQRMKRFNFKKDRNDVILPASLLTQKVLKLTGQKTIHIPGVGLREGLLVSLVTGNS